ncbi:DUF3168 domain-containing protein [Pelagibacterium xiamenense]|uniref:DUF3168 domain-containing protein n=1 Tax=Pelagibacterium xiamenense TaxID=2901140 RepID=UPI001E3A8263|nr:DUF3168 domain-containing protein [Pelagibacterium xiamenense]MCD7059491.1 DUF3168 domain-containing protein [Pelagibacterium xiamenense]
MSALNDIQAALVAAWKADAPLTLLVGDAVFDSPPRDKTPPYAAIFRHDAVPRDGDETPGLVHRIVVHCWVPHPARRGALEIAHRIERVAVAGPLAPSENIITLRRHARTETAIDLATGRARAAVHLRFHSEPAE